MSNYQYEELKKAARKVRAELAKEGIFIIKRRLKPRDKEKTVLLYEMALNRIKKYPPVRRDGVIILPYFINP